MYHSYSLPGNTLRCLIILISSAILYACGDDSQFRIQGTVDGLGTGGLTMTYISGGNVRRAETMAVDGKFTFTGVSPEYTVAEITDSRRNLISRMLIRNGQSLTCTLDADDPYQTNIEGNKPSEQWSKFLRDNSAVLMDSSDTKVNAVISDYVTRNKNNVVAALLMMTQFRAVNHEFQADSLMAVISPEARPSQIVDGMRRILSDINNGAINGNMRNFNLYSAGDSLERYYLGHSSYTLFYFTGGTWEHRDTILPRLRRLDSDYPRRQLRIYEVSMTPDTTEWKRHARLDSVPWTQLWAVGGPANSHFDKLQIPRLPFFIVCDSVGKQVVRGSSLTQVTDTIVHRLSHRRP